MTPPHSRAELCALIDHTMLIPEATPQDCERFLFEARDLGVARACIHPSLIPVAQAFMRDWPSDQTPRLVAVAGFPSGAHSVEVKSEEIVQLRDLSIEEIDAVANLSLIASEDWHALEAEFHALRAAAAGAELKLILETACFSPEQITRACEIARDAGADFVKTSTGFHTSGGASVAAVHCMAAAVGGELGIKASGGIRSAEFARALLDAGATRLGLSKTADLLVEWEALHPLPGSGTGL